MVLVVDIIGRKTPRDLTIPINVFVVDAFCFSPFFFIFILYS